MSHNLDFRATSTMAEGANIIGVSMPTMYKIAKRDDFDALVCIGRKKLLHTEKLLAWLERQTEKQQP